VTGKYQQFYDEWRKEGASSKFLNEFPYPLELGVDTLGRSFLPFQDGFTSEGKMVVTEAYDYMFHRLLGLRKRDKGTHRGAILTGQPGIGVSLRSGPHPVR